MRASPANLAGWGRHSAPLPPRSSSTRCKLFRIFVCCSLHIVLFGLVQKLVYKVPAFSIICCVFVPHKGRRCRRLPISEYFKTYKYCQFVKYNFKVHPMGVKYNLKYKIQNIILRFTQWVTARRLLGSMGGRRRGIRWVRDKIKQIKQIKKSNQDGRKEERHKVS